MTRSLAAALAHAQAPGAKPVKSYRLKQNGKLAVSKPQKVQQTLPYDLHQLAAQCDHDNSRRHERDLGLKDPLPMMPRPGFKYAPILATSRLTRPDRGSNRTQAFALSHSCDKAAHAAIQPIATTNYMPERPRVSKAILVRKMIKGKRT